MTAADETDTSAAFLSAYLAWFYPRVSRVFLSPHISRIFISAYLAYLHVFRLHLSESP